MMKVVISLEDDEFNLLTLAKSMLRVTGQRPPSYADLAREFWIPAVEQALARQSKTTRENPIAHANEQRTTQ